MSNIINAEHRFKTNENLLNDYNITLAKWEIEYAFGVDLRNTVLMDQYADLLVVIMNEIHMRELSYAVHAGGRLMMHYEDPFKLDF